VLAEPAPQVFFTGFGTTALDFELRAWTARFEAAPLVKSGLGLAVPAALTEAAIEIPYGRQDVDVRLVRDARPRDAPKTSSPLPRRRSPPGRVVASLCRA